MSGHAVSSWTKDRLIIGVLLAVTIAITSTTLSVSQQKRGTKAPASPQSRVGHAITQGFQMKLGMDPFGTLGMVAYDDGDHVGLEYPSTPGSNTSP
jgi:hypothetical protein